MTKRDAITGVAKYGIGFGLLAWVISKYWGGDPAAGTPGLKDLLQRPADLAAFGAAAVLLTAAAAVQIFRWYLLVRALDLPFTVRNAYRLGMVGLFYNSFLPGSVGGDLVKAFFIAKDSPGRRASAVATVVADRMIGLFGLILYVAVVGGGCWLAGDARIEANDYLKSMIRTTGVIVGVSAVVWGVIGLLPAAAANRLEQSLKTLPKVGHPLAELWYTVWTYRQRSKVILVAIALSAVAHTSFVFGFHMAANTFPPANPNEVGSLPEHFVTIPLGLIAQAIFPAPGGVGGGEAVFGWLYKDVIGKPAATGVVGSLTMRVCVWTIGLVGYLFYLRMRSELPIQEIEETGGDVEPPPIDDKAA